ncbi:ABC transporter permease [Thalassomonas viridans]|uniref:ABC transporter permease n=1 Tax=Thalassomonas viridans TaxID=137584 RepID=A0AAE9Z7C4_9GAMM|nr:ABC transporter permease [Thalassomonas viridans]WDE07464.1 ABC transporter permease [Thalassomonas viridans]
MWQVYKKELLELVRDRKTLFFMIALPLLIFPVIFAIMGAVVASAAIEEEQKVLRYAVINGEQASRFEERLFYHRDFQRREMPLPEEADIFAAIRSGELDLVIKVNTGHQDDLTAGQQSRWQLYFNDSSQLNQVKQKVNKVFNQYLESLRQEKFGQLGINDSQFKLLMKPVVLATVDTADERENLGEQIGGLLPYLLIVLCLTGAMYPAIDLGAGEKERGTIETLLLTPISRYALVLGKFFTIMTTGIVTALITVFSLVLWSYLIGELANVDVVARVLASVGIQDLLLMLLMLIPVSAIFAAILLSISIYARSFKEAQNYMGPMSMLGFFPVMVAMLPGIKLNWSWSLVPISNVALAIKEILKGTIDHWMLVSILASSSVFALGAILFCVYIFNKESVLFR